jgi:RNA polymerase sigma-70 factor (ECF subfamily)
MVEHELHELESWLEEGYESSYRTACLILGNRADAEEAVQDAYLRAWRFRDSLTSVPSIRPWLYRVVVNACYSKLRREIPHRDRRAGDEHLGGVPARSEGPENRAVDSATSGTVLAALERLPLSLRVPVVLRYYADLSERDIALAIGRRQGTVKSRLHEARRRLAADPDLCALAVVGDALGDGSIADVAAAGGDVAAAGGDVAAASGDAAENGRSSR